MNYHSYILLGIIASVTATVFVVQTNRNIMTKTQATFLRLVFGAYIGYCLSNVIWGFGEGGLMPWSIWANKVINFFSYAFFTGLIFFWCIFLCERFVPVILSKIWTRIALAIPMLVVVGLSFASMWNGWIFTFDETGAYSAGSLYAIIIAIDGIYLLVAIGACVYYLTHSSSRESRLTNLILTAFGPLGVLTTVLQIGVFAGEPISMGVMLVLMALLVLSLHDERIYNDALTGLNNRRRLDDYLRGVIPQVSKERPCILMIFDVDKFKKINDTYGHILGDRALKIVAKAFVIVADTTGGFVARYGGDEFVMIFAKQTVDCEKVAQSLNQAIEDLAKQDASMPCAIRLSAGNTTITNPSEKADTIIERADESLYEAKQKSRQAE